MLAARGPEAASSGDAPSACTTCGLSSKELRPCNRLNWPTMPAPPSFLPSFTVLEKQAAIRAEKTAREAAPRVPVCTTTAERKCRKCAKQNGCHLCFRWECTACATDSDTSRRFEEYHNEVDPDVDEDEYCRRSPPPCSALKLSGCVTCGKSVCHQCSTNCGACVKAVCRGCRIRHTWCRMCRYAIEDNSDFYLGPIEREEGVCGACWHKGGTRCGCGSRAYDSDLGSDGQPEESEGEWEGQEDGEAEAGAEEMG